MQQYQGRGTMQITGRQAGKSWNMDYLNHWLKVMVPAPKFKWKKLPGLRLQAYTDNVNPRGFERGLNETDLEPVQVWSQECHCGIRMSFDLWQFKTEKQITMFLMRWTS